MLIGKKGSTASKRVTAARAWSSPSTPPPQRRRPCSRPWPSSKTVQAPPRPSPEAPEAATPSSPLPPPALPALPLPRPAAPRRPLPRLAAAPVSRPAQELSVPMAAARAPSNAMLVDSLPTAKVLVPMAAMVVSLRKSHLSGWNEWLTKNRCHPHKLCYAIMVLTSGVVTRSMLNSVC